MSDLLQVSGLGTWFYTRQGIVKAVDDVEFSVAAGETLAIVGESGCGKSMTALSLMRLIPDPPGRIVSGSIKLGDRDLLQLSEKEMRGVRGNDISMIFQEPMTSLNPVMTIGKQIGEALILHRDMDKKAAMKRAVAHWRNDEEWSRVRPPLVEIAPRESASLIDELEAAGFDMPGIQREGAQA